MKNRGMSDMLIACTDNLTGMSEAISAVYPKCEHQLCIVHQIRNSLKYVSYKDRKELVADLKPIYQEFQRRMQLIPLLNLLIPSGASSIHKLLNPGTIIGKIWCYFCQYPESIRKIIYTTNAIESLNSQLRRVTKNKRVFPSDESVFKTLYLTINYITAKWTMPIQNWGEAMAPFFDKV